MRTLETERLTLRPLTVADVEFVFDLYSRFEVQRYIGAVPRVMDDRAEAIERIERWGSIDDPVQGVWAIVVRETARPVGMVLLKPIPASGDVLPLQPSGDVEIGWHQHPDAWGNGFATEAASAVLQSALASGLERVVAVTNPANTASQRVARRIGMHDLGLTDDFYNQTCRLFEALPEPVPLAPNRSTDGGTNHRR
jgi:RimJ/RimL family protein N-acetyltransferase